MPLTRRHFMRLTAGSAAAGALFPLETIAQSAVPSAPTIERVTVLRVPGSFNRPVAMNAYDNAPKGKAGTIRLVRLILSDGTTGLGVEGYNRIDDETVSGLRELIGVNPLEVYQWEGDRIQGLAPAYRDVIRNPRFSWFETPLLDAVGKLKEQPVYALFGTPVREGVDAYDGTLYFKDVELETGPEVIGDVAARIKADGYKAIKMKVGRPRKWVKGEAGVERDIAAVRAARDAVGANFNLMADANNGYQDQFDWAVRFLEETAPDDLYWMEEIFPETQEKYRRLRRVLSDRGISVRIAEGENAMFGSGPLQTLDDFQPWLEAGLFDVIQPDMRTVGFSNVLYQADQAARYGKTLVPHNWQSQMGLLMSLHAARIRENMPFAEDDRWTNYALDTSDYRFQDGQWQVPETPGWGATLSEHYDRFARASDELVIS